MKSHPLQTVFLTSESPFSAHGGAKIRNSSLIHLLLEKGEVEVLCFGTSAGHTSAGLRLSAITKEKTPFYRRIFSPFRPYVVNGFSPEMAKALQDRAAPKKLLWVDRLAMAQYIPLAHSLGYRVVLDEHNVESDVLMKGAVASWKDWPKIPIALQCFYYEARFCSLADLVIATSEVDARRLETLAPKADVHIIPNLIDAEDYASCRKSGAQNLFFAGTLSYFPNIEGLNWFIDQVLPLLRTQLSADLPKIVVAGSNPSPSLQKKLTMAGVELHANPDSILPLLGDASIVLVPILSGSGTRLKILEAMAASKAIVSTPKGAEGLEVASGRDILLAHSPSEFCAAIVRLIKNPNLRTQMGAHALETVEHSYDWRSARPKMERALHKITGSD